MDLFKLLGIISIQNGEANDELEETGKKAEETKEKISKAFSGIGKGALALGKAVGAGMLAAGTAVAGLVSQSTSAYAEYEQLVGGVDTLFKESSAKVQAYAEKAYETAGLSANEYMSTVTSFSASLLQSLGGDTDKAAEKANTAIIDMADNANKMGTSIDMIQNAYNGFAKQNYTMLDNLKLGYGGTKEEMQRLLDDAEKIAGTEFDISNYGDIVDAIHVMQQEMGIAGATSAEAASTISGSMSSVKGAWQNLITAMASDELPLDEYITKFVDSAVVMVGNMMPRIKQALVGVVQLVSQLAPTILGEIPGLLSEILPSIIQAATSLINELVAILPELTDTILAVAPSIIDGFIQIIVTLIPALVEVLVASLETLLPALIDGFITLVVTICNNISQILQPLVDAFPDIVINIVDALMQNLPILIEGLITLVLGIVNSITDILVVFWDAYPMIIDMVMSALIENLPLIIAGLIQLVLGIVQALPKILTALITALPKILKTILSLIFDVFSNLDEWFGEKFTQAKEKIINAWSNFKQYFVDLWNSIKDVFSGVGSFFGGLWDTIKEKFSDLGTKISESISGAVKKGINGLIGGAENVVNGFLGMVNNAIDIINEIPGVKITKVKLVEFARLAKGGVVDKPTPAIFGEDGAEAVVPLENNTGWIDRVAQRLHDLTIQNGTGMGSISIRSVELQQAGVSELKILNSTVNKVLTAILMMDENMGGHLREAMEGMTFDINHREFARLVKGVI